MVALALSSRFPIGVAREAEPDPGFAVDPTVLLLGGLSIVAVTVVSAAISGLARLHPRAVPGRPSRLTGAAHRLGLGPAAVQGVRFAVSREASHPVPMRSTVAAVTVAVTTVVATITFANSLVALLDTPARYGQGWDRMIDAQFGPAPVGRIIDRIGASDDVEGIAVGTYGDVSVEGLPVAAFDLQPVVGDVSVTIVEGRAARSADEIVLGTQTMRSVGCGGGIDGPRRRRRGAASDACHRAWGLPAHGSGLVLHHRAGGGGPAGGRELPDLLRRPGAAAGLRARRAHATTSSRSI